MYLNSPIKQVEQIQLFNIIKRKYGGKVSKEELTQILKGQQQLEFKDSEFQPTVN